MMDINDPAQSLRGLSFLCLFVCGRLTADICEVRMTEVLEVVVLSMSEKSSDLVSSEIMCSLAEQTGLRMLEQSELSQLTKQKESVCIVPYHTVLNKMEFALLETFSDRVHVRPMAVASSAGWSPKCPWLFKR
jgi:hypothetical protein